MPWEPYLIFTHPLSYAPIQANNLYELYIIHIQKSVNTYIFETAEDATHGGSNVNAVPATNTHIVSTQKLGVADPFVRPSIYLHPRVHQSLRL